jgi:hypothetical protein
MHGGAARRLAALTYCFSVSTNPVFLNLLAVISESQVPEERRQVDAASPVLAVNISLVALSLRHDLGLMQVMLSLAKGLFALDLSSAEFSAHLWKARADYSSAVYFAFSEKLRVRMLAYVSSLSQINDILFTHRSLANCVYSRQIPEI